MSAYVDRCMGVCECEVEVFDSQHNVMIMRLFYRDPDHAALKIWNKRKAAKAAGNPISKSSHCGINISPKLCPTGKHSPVPHLPLYIRNVIWTLFFPILLSHQDLPFPVLLLILSPRKRRCGPSFPPFYSSVSRPSFWAQRIFINYLI